jgi:hypothetical protein
MATFIPCPSCGKNLVDGVLAPCPSCGWVAQPHEKEAMIRDIATQQAQLVGRLHGSRIRLVIFALVSLAINILLVGAVILLLVR